MHAHRQMLMSCNDRTMIAYSLASFGLEIRVQCPVKRSHAGLTDSGTRSWVTAGELPSKACIQHHENDLIAVSNPVGGISLMLRRRTLVSVCVPLQLKGLQLDKI